VTGDWRSLIEECLKFPEAYIQEAGIAAFPNYVLFYEDENGRIEESIIGKAVWPRWDIRFSCAKKEHAS